MSLRHALVLLVCGAFANPFRTFADEYPVSLFRDFVVIQKETAEAKEVRLKWISSERNRIADELKQFSAELAELDKIVPRPVQPRTLSNAQAEELRREQNRFRDWAANNNPERKAAIHSGSALNSLLRVLGRTAHLRKTRAPNAPGSAVFPSLDPKNDLAAADWQHLRMNPANASGAKSEIRLNQLPLEIIWPVVLVERFGDDCSRLDQTRNAFLASLSPGEDVKIRIDRAEVLDKSLSLLLAKTQKEKRVVVRELTLDSTRRNKIHTDLCRSLDYLHSLRATVERLKEVPAEYRKVEFQGGSIENFLEFCFLNDLTFLEAKPEDQPYYSRVFHRMQDYARDLQYVEDWRNGLDQRIGELSVEDKQLVWRASVE